MVEVALLVPLSLSDRGSWAVRRDFGQPVLSLRVLATFNESFLGLQVRRAGNNGFVMTG